MSRKKRKDVEFEADLKNKNSPDSKVEDSGVNDSDNYNANKEQSDNEDNVTDPNTSEDIEPKSNTSSDNNDSLDGNEDEISKSPENNRVFDKDPEDLEQGSRESRVENPQPTNDNVGTNDNNENEPDDNGDEAKSNNNDDISEKQNETSNDDSISDNDENDKRISDDDNNQNFVTDASEKEDSNVTPKEDTSLQDSKLGNLAGKASDTLDTLNKAKKFNDIKNMSKEQAAKELYEVGKTVVKQKVMTAVATTVGPYVLPVILGILALLLVILFIMGVAMNNSEKNKSLEEGCKVVKENSSDLKDSEDADKNAETIFKEVKSKVKGSTDKGVAALLGNIYVESAHTFSSKTIQGGNEYKSDIANDPTVGGYAFGFSQWDSERRVNLIKFGKKQGKKWDDMGVQIDFLLNHDSTDSDLIKKLVKQDKDVKQTTEDIMNKWERAGDTSSISERQSAASKYYSKFSGKSSDSNIDDATDAASDNSDATENSGCASGDSSGKTSGKMGASVKANGKSGEIIKKWSSKDKIPEKYKKHIELPDFKESVLDSSGNPFASSGLKGQCTELTYGYMKQLYSGDPPTNGNGNAIYKAYKSAGAKVTDKPTVGYGFSANPPYAGAADSSVGHTGVVIGVMEDGKWIMANYNLNGEANGTQKRVETFALVDGNKKEDGIKFFSGIGKPKIKSKD